ncbi:hypothetical protein FH972_008095 [Carpinus fangiana]|uniref:Uncharacterized protein n=1 Tax=Carpinus fangiana TaxID=176857 RepID=A0A5N6QXK7_9ROSI|nr:hypothetical protein FH972_008095 [Carpinus fangiana]
MVSGPPRCKKINGAHNALNWLVGEIVLLESAWASVSLAIAAVASQSAAKYAIQTVNMIQDLTLDLLRLPKMKSVICKMRLRRTIARMSHAFHIFLTHNGSGFMILIY